MFDSFFPNCRKKMEKKDDKSASKAEEIKGDASAEDPMLKIEEDYESKQFGQVAQNKELDLYLVSIILMPAQNRALPHIRLLSTSCSIFSSKRFQMINIAIALFRESSGPYGSS